MSKELNDDDFYSADSRKECSCGRVFAGRFCPKCGKEYVYEVRCPKCGMMNSGSDNFCSECGARLESDPKKTKAPKKPQFFNKVKGAFKKIGKKKLIIIGSSFLGAVVLALAIYLIIHTIYWNNYKVTYGDSWDDVISAYGAPDEQDFTLSTGSELIYYSKEYDDIAKRLEAASTSQLPTVQNEIRSITFTKMVIRLNSAQRVEGIEYNASTTYFERYPSKTAQGDVRILSKSCDTRYGVYWDIVFVAEYSDGSYVVESVSEVEGIKVDDKIVCKWWDNWANQYREIVVD